jgi:hypothetical protein
MKKTKRASLSLLAASLLCVALHSNVLAACSTGNVRAVKLEDGQWVLMRDDGKILTATKYCGGGDLSDGLFRFENCDGASSSYLTPDGKVALAVKADRTGPFSEGLAAIRTAGGLLGYIDKTGKTVIPGRFEDADPFSDGLAAVELDGQWQYINQTGATALAPSFAGHKISRAWSFKSGAALVAVTDPATGASLNGLISPTGAWLIPPTKKLAGALDGGLAPMWSDAQDKLGFGDATGKTVIAPQFASVSAFQENLAEVEVTEGGKSKVGFIDRLGKWVIPAQYDSASSFCGGLALVEVGDKWGYINPAGKAVIAPAYPQADSFDGGVAEVWERGDKGESTECLDHNGKVIYRSKPAVEVEDE